MHWSDAVGVVGTALILLAFLMLQTGRMSSLQLRYSVLNGVGAALILVSLVYSFNLAAFIIEACWVLISLIGIVRHLIGRGRRVEATGDG